MLDAPKTDEELDTKTRLLKIKTEEQLEDHKFDVYAWRTTAGYCMSAPFAQSLQHVFAHASDAMNELSRHGVVLNYKTEDMKVRQSEMLPAEIQSIVKRFKTTWEIGEVTDCFFNHLSVVAIGADKNVQRARSLKIGMCIAVVVSLTEEERMKITEKKYPALTYVMKHCQLVDIKVEGGSKAKESVTAAAPTLGKHKGGSKAKESVTAAAATAGKGDGAKRPKLLYRSRCDVCHGELTFGVAGGWFHALKFRDRCRKHYEELPERQTEKVFSGEGKRSFHQVTCSSDLGNEKHKY